MKTSSRWSIVLTISFLLTVLIGWLDFESKSLLDVFQAQNVPALFIYSALFTIPVAAVVYFGEWVVSFFRPHPADPAGT